MNTQSRIGRWSLILGIIVVLNLFFNYTLSLFYKEPDYNAYCPMEQVVNVPTTQNECVSQGGQWTTDPNYGKPTPAGYTQPAGYCNLQYTCQPLFETANNNYNRNVFIILVILGALSVFVGNYLGGNEVIGSGLSLAGVLSFIIASLRYWSAANDYIHVLILAIALGILFWVAWKKFGNRMPNA